MDGVVVEHIKNQRDEGIVDRHHLNIGVGLGTKYETTNTTETVDTNLDRAPYQNKQKRILYT